MAEGQTILGDVATKGVIVTSDQPVTGMSTVYVSGDVVGTLVAFTDIVRNNGGGGIVESLELIETTTQGVNAELWLFDRPIAAAADNAAHSISDADSLFAVGVIPLTLHFASALNSVSTARGVGMAFQCRNIARDLYGLLVTRGAPPYAVDGIRLKLSVIQE